MKPTKEQIDFIKNKYIENDLNSLVCLFNREFGTDFSKDKIRGIIQRNQIKKKDFFIWNSDMDNFLMENSEKNRFIATEEFNDFFKTNISVGAYVTRCYKIGAKVKTHKKTRHTKEEIKFIIENSDAKIETLVSMVNEKFGLKETKDSVYKILSRNGKPRDKEYHFTDEEFEFIKNNFAEMTLDVFMQKFNENFSRNANGKTLRIIANKMGVKKRGWELREIYPIGTEVINQGRIIIKVGMPNEWMYKNRYVYEKETGLSANDLFVLHLDGNPMNCDISNLIAVDKKTLGMANGHKLLIKNNPQLTSVGLDLARLMVLLKESEE